MLLCDAWPDLSPQAWVKNRRGVPHHVTTVGRFTDELPAAIEFLSASALLHFYRQFDILLDRALGSGTGSSKGAVIARVGPTLARSGPKGTLGLPRVLRADLVRVVRNCFAHADGKHRHGVLEDRVADWRQHVAAMVSQYVRTGRTPVFDSATVVAAADRAIEYYVRKANRSAIASRQPAEYFLALFGFTDLSLLAFRVDEILCSLELSTERVWVPEDLVRRKERIELPALPQSQQQKPPQ